MAGRLLALVTPRPAEPPPAVKPPPTPCPVCGVAAFTDTGCDVCHADMHEPCYWRTVPMSVWHEYLVALADPADYPNYPPYRCGACRERDALGRDGA